MTRPTIDEIREVLIKHNCLIVHFSGCPKGIGLEQKNSLYPNDLLNVISGGALSGVSCSTVNPGDNFSGFNRNATGNIGVVIAPITGDSLVAVSEKDLGSFINELGERVTIPQPNIAKLDLENSINHRSPAGYNEWVVKNFYVKGILAAYPFQVTAQQTVSCDDSNYNSIEYIPQSKVITEVGEEFTEQTIFSFVNGKLCKLKDDGFEPVLLSEIY